MSHHTGVMTAIQAGDLETLRILLAEEADRAACRDESGVSAIMHALYRRRPDLAEVLVSYAPTLDIFEAVSLGRTNRAIELLNDAGMAAAWSADGFTPLHLACFFGQEKMAELLLARGADANAAARNPMKVRPLHSAAAAGNFRIVITLLARGASPNVQQQGGWTPLHSAAQHGHRAMVEVLLQHGADRAVKSDEGTLPSEVARKHGHEEIAVLLS